MTLGTGSPAPATQLTMRNFLRAAALSLAVLVPLACGDDASPAQMVGYSLTPPPQVGNLALPAADGAQPVGFAPAAGHLKVVYFGYTSCPDVCPTTLADLKAALARIKDDAKRIEVAMITVDPKRDTAETLPAYVRSFVPDAQALRTEDDAVLRKVADAFGANYSVTTNAEGKVEVEHTGSLYVINPAGEIVDVLSYPTPAKDIANDLGILLRRSK